MGEGTPQSSALTEGDFVPDSPALSPIELKQELPKYLPALQVRCPLHPRASSAFSSWSQLVAESRTQSPSVGVQHLRGPGCLYSECRWPGSAISLPHIHGHGLAYHLAALVGKWLPRPQPGHPQGPPHGAGR